MIYSKIGSNGRFLNYESAHQKDEQPGGEDVISFRHVNKYYGDFHVLKDINLEVKEGEVVVVIGLPDQGRAQCSAVSTAWKKSRTANSSSAI